MNKFDPKSKWVLPVCAAVSCGLGVATLYFLLKKTRSLTAVDASPETPPKILATNVDEVSTEKVHEILREVAKSQEQVLRASKEATKQLVQAPLSFEEAYNLVKATQPVDALEQYGLSIHDFDKLLGKHQNDPAVAELVRKIMHAPDVSGSQKNVSFNTIVEVHTFMLEFTENLTRYFSSKPDKASYDVNTVAVTVQCMVAAAVENKFDITSEDLESSISTNFDAVAKDEHLKELSQKLGKAMDDLMKSSDSLAPSSN